MIAVLRPVVADGDGGEFDKTAKIIDRADVIATYRPHPAFFLGPYDEFVAFDIDI
jgi:hypothetical protein